MMGREYAHYTSRWEYLLKHRLQSYPLAHVPESWLIAELVRWHPLPCLRKRPRDAAILNCYSYTFSPSHQSCTDLLTALHFAPNQRLY